MDSRRESGVKRYWIHMFRIFNVGVVVDLIESPVLPSLYGGRIGMIPQHIIHVGCIYPCSTTATLYFDI
ncbi:uncharacterized protein BDZ83DRAFT_636671 [Colletotrichum acutatum]|uniref:Uncharacterized protein n=1 Tax=Glomerella acutata TaxID=27357 RepID=A0AAD8UBF3_GLOAC|nr:uncharacterized protein BDZ83DRAFT_636671 [Colletotrichum acutatum]KAK1714111.1 hypothetical protein BDZ83DRAFT_636671 [Colletotrichum acutatum]